MINRDIVSGGVLAGLSVWYFVMTLAFPQGRGEPGPAFMPQVVAGLLFLVAVSILVGGIRAQRTRKPATVDGDDLDAMERPWAPWAAMAGTVAYAVAFIPAGFWISTLLYAAFIAWIFRARSWFMLIVIPAASTGIIFLLFRVLLGSRLPAGPFS